MFFTHETLHLMKSLFKLGFSEMHTNRADWLLVDMEWGKLWGLLTDILFNKPFSKGRN